MHIQTIRLSNNLGNISILNRNRITEENVKEAIKAMGLSACQVGCMSRGCCTHYNSKH